MNTSKNISGTDIPTRKLALIEWIVRLDDVATIKEIEAICKKRQIAKHKQMLDAMSEKASKKGLTSKKLKQLLSK